MPAQRSTVTFTSGDDKCEAWLYMPEGAGSARLSAVVMAHGLGGVKSARLGAYAERFTAAGYACVVFDYRHFGTSGGQPRQLLDIGRQLEDWNAAIDWTRAQPRLDPDRVVAWGTSLGGGHVLSIAARDKRLAATIAQCPFTDGLASARVAQPWSAARVAALGVADEVASRLGGAPVTVPIVGPPGSVALMTSPDAEPGYHALIDDEALAGGFEDRVAARVVLQISGYRPGTRVGDIVCPVLFAICEHDSVAPASAARRAAADAPLGEVHEYACGHFDIYLGEWFERATADMVAFLDAHVGQ